MATIPRNSPTSSVDSSAQARRSREELRRDRINGGLVLLGMIALLGVLAWLASFGGPLPANDLDWTIMP